ncbi:MULTISPECIES: hypothetical protein [Cohnella]|uniref:hypothetical protein n=1 Tax=Cohnella TaxID=329857 RepID=UPI001592F4DA|nr:MULTISPECIES: hypothetical protein [Cohnella]MBN2983235.1 hypothetical protein [Cohnella algarum]
MTDYVLESEIEEETGRIFIQSMAIYEIYRPKDVDFVTLFRYRWNGRVKEYVKGNE